LFYVFIKFSFSFYITHDYISVCRKNSTLKFDMPFKIYVKLNNFYTFHNSSKHGFTLMTYQISIQSDLKF
jgi:hypothetical protein